MTIVAGCSMLKGVMLVADTRATVLRPGREPVYVDGVQKLIALTPTTALGFAGDIGSAAILLRELIGQMRRLRPTSRLHPVRLSDWMPRLFRAVYARRGAALRDDLAFMVASVVPGRPNVVKRARATALMQRFLKEELVYQRSWLPDIMVQILKTPADARFVRIGDAPLGALYTMRAPHFQPEPIRTLGYSVIGSGAAAAPILDRHADMLFAGHVGNPAMESAELREVVHRYVEQSGDMRVGGLLPCLSLSGRGLEAYGVSAEIPFEGERISLIARDDGRWVQRHENSGTEVVLSLPWELDLRGVYGDRRFDYLLEARKAFSSPRADADAYSPP